MKKLIGLSFVIFSLGVSAEERLDIGAAQGAMHNRISEAIEIHAKNLGLSQEVITYCRIEANRATDEFPRNGSIPFGGIDYNKITDARVLEMVISSREAYEKTFIKLCLSKAKRELSPNNY